MRPAFARSARPRLFAASRSAPAASGPATRPAFLHAVAAHPSLIKTPLFPVTQNIIIVRDSPATVLRSAPTRRRATRGPAAPAC